MRSKKRGRPLKNDAKKYEYRLRQSSDDREQLQVLSNFYAVSKADIIRMALDQLEKRAFKDGFVRDFLE